MHRTRRLHCTARPEAPLRHIAPDLTKTCKRSATSKAATAGAGYCCVGTSCTPCCGQTRHSHQPVDGGLETVTWPLEGYLAAFVSVAFGGASGTAAATYRSKQAPNACPPVEECAHSHQLGAGAIVEVDQSIGTTTCKSKQCANPQIARNLVVPVVFAGAKQLRLVVACKFNRVQQPHLRVRCQVSHVNRHACPDSLLLAIARCVVRTPLRRPGGSKCAALR